jgi:hypothetical protein
MKPLSAKKPLNMGILQRLHNQFFCHQDKVNYVTVKGFTPQFQRTNTPIF